MRLESSDRFNQVSQSTITMAVRMSGTIYLKIYVSPEKVWGHG